jgi:O-antigen/teichoic acid export membrane protein
VETTGNEAAVRPQRVRQQDSAPAQPTLRSRVAGGLRWKILSQVVGQLTRTVVGILLAHLLTPSQFGLAAMALVFGGLLSIFKDVALGAALVQKREITERDRSTVFWTTIACGAAIAGIGIAVSPLVAGFFGRPAVGPLFAVTAGTALVYSLGGTQMALRTRELDFRSLELREMGATLAGGVAAVTLAVAGAGAWAIILQNLVVAGVSAALLWSLSSWRPRLVFSRESLRTLGSFGIKTMLSRLLSYANLNADNLLVGRFLGSVSLGVYAIAYNVMFLPVTRIAAPITQVMFPAFARLQHDHEALGRSWIRGTQLVSMVNVPAFLGMAVVAPDFVPVVLGGRWHAAVPVLQLLSLAGVMQSFQTLDWSVLQAVGRSGRLLRYMLFGTAVTVAAFVVGLRWGVVGVAALFAVARTITSVTFGWTTCRAIGLPFTTFARGATPVVRVAAPTAAGVYLLRIGLVSAGLPPAPRLVLLVLAGIAIWGGLIAWQARDLAAELARLLLPGVARRLGRTAPVPTR